MEGKILNNLAVSYKQLSDLVDTSQTHNFTCLQIKALETAKKAILIVELLGICVQSENICHLNKNITV